MFTCPCLTHLDGRGFSRLLSVTSPVTGATLTVLLGRAEDRIPGIGRRLVDGRAAFTRAELAKLVGLADDDRRAAVRVGRRIEFVRAFNAANPRTR